MALEVPYLSLEKLAVLQRLLGARVDGRVAMEFLKELSAKKGRFLLRLQRTVRFGRAAR